MITIDANLCQKDGLCVLECPVAILVMEDKDSIPKLVEGGEEVCLRCGHCVAVCPHGALSHRDTPLEISPQIDMARSIDQVQAVQFLRSRRSVRVFKDKPVDRKIIEKLIKIASYAPTGGNLQMVEWAVYDDRDKLHEIGNLAVDWMRQTLKKYPNLAPPYMVRVVEAWEAGHDQLFRNAPAVILGMVNKDARNGLVDTTIALTYLDLAAPTFGLGTCWAGLLQGAMMNWPPVKEAMGITDNYPHHYPMMIGYNRVKYHRMVERKEPQISWK